MAYISKINLPNNNTYKILSNFYAVCDTAAGTAAKTVTIDDFVLQTGVTIVVKFTNNNTVSSPTLKVNDTDAKPIYRYGTTAASGINNTTGWHAGSMIALTYDGTGWIMNRGYNYYTDTNTNVAFGQGYGTCSTAAATTTKSVTLTDYSLVLGGIVSVKFTNSVPANATMSINSKTAKAIYYRGAAIGSNIIQAGDTATFIYDGSYYHLLAVDKTVQFSAFVSETQPTTASVNDSWFVIENDIYNISYSINDRTVIQLSNNITSIKANSTYTSEIYLTRSLESYEQLFVQVKMGGTNITSNVYNSSTNIINISEVTGNIEITVQIWIEESVD